MSPPEISPTSPVASLSAPRSAPPAWLVALLTFVAVPAVYWPVLRGEFLCHDELDVLKNTALRDAAGLCRN